jgi:hypothetical protein
LTVSPGGDQLAVDAHSRPVVARRSTRMSDHTDRMNQ